MAKTFKLGAVTCKLVNKPMRDGKVRIIEFERCFKDGSKGDKRGIAWNGSRWFEVYFQSAKYGSPKRWAVDDRGLGWQYAHWFDWSLRGWIWQNVTLFDSEDAAASEVNELAQRLEALAGLPVTDQEQYTRVTPSMAGDRSHLWWRSKVAKVELRIYETHPGGNGKRFDVLDHEYPDLDSALADVDRLTSNAERVSFGLTDDGSKGKLYVYLSAYPYNGDIRYSDDSRRSNEDAMRLLDLIRGEPCPGGSIAVRRDNRAAALAAVA